MKERHVSAMVFYDKDKRILLQDRRNIKKFGEEWGFFGGGIESGETPEQALVREMKEELDYDITEEARHIKTFDFTFPERDFRLVVHVFIMPLADKLQKFKVLEGDGAELYTIAEARKLKMFDSDHIILDELETVLGTA